MKTIMIVALAFSVSACSTMERSVPLTFQEYVAQEQTFRNHMNHVNGNQLPLERWTECRPECVTITR